MQEDYKDNLYLWIMKRCTLITGLFRYMGLLQLAEYIKDSVFAVHELNMISRMFV